VTLRVLAVDDSRTIRDMVRYALESAGMSVVTANDGEEGVTAFGAADFDAVITDINMPRLDGFGVIARIRSAPRNSRVPVLVLTTENGDALKLRARDSGATGWLVKPFDDDELVDVVRRVAGR
jgi:two-component system, chemotaxis family, chemotaxis protein CheY